MNFNSVLDSNFCSSAKSIQQENMNPPASMEEVDLTDGANGGTKRKTPQKLPKKRSGMEWNAVDSVMKKKRRRAMGKTEAVMRTMVGITKNRGTADAI